MSMACAKLGIPISLSELLIAPRSFVQYLASFVEVKAKQLKEAK